MRNDKRIILIIVLAFAGFVYADEGGKQAKTCIRGCVKTAQGLPVAGVEVRCFYFDPKYDYDFEYSDFRELFKPEADMDQVFNDDPDIGTFDDDEMCDYPQFYVICYFDVD